MASWVKYTLAILWFTTITSLTSPFTTIDSNSDGVIVELPPFQLNKFKDAEKFYKYILKKAPKHFGSVFYLGTLFLQTNKFGLAKRLLQKAIQIGLRLGCKINNRLLFQRKHYSWPDSPNNYPRTMSGSYAVPVGEAGEFEGIRITQVHLEEDPAKPRYIQTVWGLGYVFVPEGKAAVA